MGTLTIVGELENKQNTPSINLIPNSYLGKNNYKCIFPIEIRKNLPNLSPILFQSIPNIQANTILSESVGLDTDDSNYTRGYLNVSASHLKTFGGKVDRIELSYREQKAKNTEYIVLTTYPLISNNYEITSSLSGGLNPISDLQKFPIPKEIRRNKAVDFRLRFLNADGVYAQDITKNNVDVEITKSLTNVTGSPLILETNDNLVTGSGKLVFGKSLNEGIKLEYNEVSESLKFVHVKGGKRNEIKEFSGNEGGYELGGKVDSQNIKGKVSGSSILSGKNHSLQSSTGSAILTGQENTISASSVSAVLSGKNNQVLAANHAAVLGGELNKVQSGSEFSMVLGGQNNTITENIDSVVVGGTNNSLDITSHQHPASASSNIVGGTGIVLTGAASSVALGGRLHKMKFTKGTNVGFYNTIIGGEQCTISASSNDAPLLGATVVGAISSQIDGVGNVFSAIVAGLNNKIVSSSNTHAQNVIIGGYSNTINSVKNSVILGSGACTITHDGVAIIGMTSKTSTAANTVYINNLDVDGKITANEFHTTLTSASIIYNSGSTKFGDTADDKHSFTGSLSVKGVYGHDANDIQYFRGKIALSGSAGVNDRVELYTQAGKALIWNKYDDAAGDIEIRTQGFNNAIVIDNSATSVGIGDDSPSAKLDVGGNLQVQSHITASGQISSSGTGTNYFGGDILLTGTNIYFTDTGTKINANTNAMTLDGDNSILLTVDNRLNIDSPAVGIGSGLALAYTAPKTLSIKGDVSASGNFELNGSGSIGVAHPVGTIPNHGLLVSGSISGSRLYAQGSTSPMVNLKRTDGTNVNAVIQFENGNGSMFAGIDGDIQNSSANIFGIGYSGDLIDNNGTDHATFVVTGSQVVINNATSASVGVALTVGGELHTTSHITSSGNILAQSEDARIRVEATAGNHPGFEWFEAGSRKWILYNDPDSSQGGNDNLTWKNASDTELMELDQDGILYVSSKIAHLDDTDTFINFTTDNINFKAGNQNMIDLTSGSQSEITFNEAGIDIDFRVEGDSDANLLFTNAGTDRVGIGTNSPNEKLGVQGNISASGTFTGNFPDTNDNATHYVLISDAQNGTLETQNTLTLNPSTNVINAGNISVNNGKVYLENSTGHITASGNISSSGTYILANRYDIQGEKFAARKATGIFEIGQGGASSLDLTNITASGNISSSGNIITTGDVSGSSTSTGSFGSLYISSSIDVDGTANLDAVDIDGTVQIDGNTSFGVNDTGVDVTLYGATANRRAHWDESVDHLKFYDNTRLAFGTHHVSTGYDSSIIHDGSETIFRSACNMRLSNSSGNTIIENYSPAGEIQLILDKESGGSANTGRVLISGSATSGVSLDVRGGITASGNISASDMAIGKFSNLSPPVGKFTVHHGNPTGSIQSGLGKGYGDIIGIRSDVTVTAGQIYRLQSNGNFGNEADKDDILAATSLLGVAMGTNSTTDGMLLRGFVQVSQSGQLTLGQKVYLGDEGIVTGSHDNFASGDFIRVLGYCIDSGNSNGSASIYFNPSNDWIEKA